MIKLFVVAIKKKEPKGINIPVIRFIVLIQERWIYFMSQINKKESKVNFFLKCLVYKEFFDKGIKVYVFVETFAFISEVIFHYPTRVK